MQKRITYLGIGFTVLGLVLVFLSSVVVSEAAYYILNGSFSSLDALLKLKSLMMWSGILFSVGGAVTIIYGVSIDDQPPSTKRIQGMTREQKPVIPLKTAKEKNPFCFNCGIELEGKPVFCYQCGIKLR